MANPVATAIGRVQPIFRGTWDSTLSYTKLDNVLYEGCTYIAIQNAPAGANPSSVGSPYWQMIASKGDSIKGDTGSFGTPTATAHGLDFGEEPTVGVTASGPDDAKVFAFDFGLPAGPLGFDEVAASATTLPAGANPTASAELVTQSDVTTLSFVLGIPAAEGEGIKQLDGLQPDGAGRLTYNGIRAIQNQGLSNLQQQYARENINAQVAGNYQPAGDYIVDPDASTGQFLRFSNEGEWVGATINLVPTGAASDINKYLRKTAGGMVWADVQSLPSGGAEGAPLVKRSVDDYDATWGSFISEAEIDAIINAN